MSDKGSCLYRAAGNSRQDNACVGLAHWSASHWQNASESTLYTASLAGKKASSYKTPGKIE